MKAPKFYKWIFYLMLLIMSSHGFYKGVVNEGGLTDAQWYPANLFSENIEFYGYFLENSDDWFLTQAPNYYFQLYYLLQPLTYVSWNNFKLIWFFINLTLLLIFLFYTKERFHFNYKDMSIILLPFFLGIPLTTTLGNGQFGIIIIALSALAWKFREHKILLPVLLSLLTIKYSFGVPIAFGFFLMGYYRSVIASALITLVFPLIYSIQFNLDFLSTIFLPFKVSSVATKYGPSDLMSLYRLMVDDQLMEINILTLGLLAIFIAFFYVSRKYKLSKQTIFLCSLVFSLYGFFHLEYDAVIFLLILPFVFYMKHFRVLYGYLLILFLMPRLIGIYNLVTDAGLDFREVMRNKYFVIFNICCLLTYFLLLIKIDVASRSIKLQELK